MSAPYKLPGSAKEKKEDASLDPPAFEEKSCIDKLQNDPSSSGASATADRPSRFGASGVLARPCGENAAQQNMNCSDRSKQLSGQHFQQLSVDKGDHDGSVVVLPSAGVPSSVHPIQAADQEERASSPSGGTVCRSNVETKGSGLGPSVTRPGHTPNLHAVACDTVTMDTRDGISRSRLSAQVLRGILGSGEKKSGGTPRRQANSSGVPNNRTSAIEANPLRPSSRLSATSGSEGNVEMEYRNSLEYGDGVSSTQSSGAQIHVRAEEMHPRGDGGDYDGADTFGDEQSFTNRRGKLEWLRTPSLFYFFANVIRWNELQLQRRAFMNSWQARQQQDSQGTASLVSVWTQHRERELRTLEAHISFSVFELDGIYLNRLLMSWSKPKLRALVAEVVTTWKEEGPSSAKFDSVSSRLFDAISSEESCQLRCTWVFNARQWLGLARHRWIVTGMFTMCFVVAILCVVFLAVFGRTREGVCIVLSAVLGVAVFSMYFLAMFIVHHNTYAAAAAIYFREAAVRAAQQKMKEEELKEVDDLTGANSYLGGSEEKYSGLRGRTMGGLANSNDTDTRSDYTAEQTSLAVRNLRALTEGSSHPGDPAGQYCRLLESFLSGVRESGTAAGGYYHDDMTFTDDNVPSFISRSPHIGDSAKPKPDRDCDNTLLLSSVTYEQHQKYLKQRQSLLVQETMSSSRVRSDRKDGVGENRFEGHMNDKAQESENSSGIRHCANGADGAVDGPLSLQQLADLPDKVNITALIYCNNISVLSEVVSSLWERMYIVLRVADLCALDNTFKHGSERFKVVLIHAPDAPDGSEVLLTALSWLQVERRPVFFISRQTDSFAHQVPSHARLKVPLTSASINMLFLAGIGVEAEQGSISFSAFLQQEQSPSHPFQAPPYVLGRRLGGGAFGNVFEAELEGSGAKCAVKRMYLKEDSDAGGHDGQGGYSSTAANTSAHCSASGEPNPSAGEVGHTTSSKAGEAAGNTANNSDDDGCVTEVGSQLRDIAQEVEIMSSLQHPNIVRYYFCERDDNCISIFMELCTGGSLSSLIHSGKLVNPPEIKLLLREIISAVAYLHSLRIVHRDLKPDNVLFRQGHVKITDFGTAVHKHGCDLRLIKGTFAYMAPETLVGEPYGSACDVWSIGCIAAEVLSVDLPQHALGLPAMCEYYRTMEKDCTLPIECDVPGVRDFLLACLRRDPSRRSTATELFYHPLLQARDTSTQLWMKKVVEQRRHKHILQQKMSHRIGPGARSNGGPGSGNAGPNSLHGSNVRGRGDGDGFDLSSGNGSIISLDSSRLTGHEDQVESLLTP
ncbi:putative protein kinase [Leptomonas seymouri]|uniref:Protein kinase domain-containing protein n=1 Tax=Leptomonas seymouri TaxID=5684 RepID=A0A0N0P2E5_LEPSE|nr:putative protein kinase [Leptomonas seymouri]|eukprot:KPI82859.1 putative protein kinase [Leptomonas seymouri]